jgi:hypothetical protein
MLRNKSRLRDSRSSRQFRPGSELRSELEGRSLAAPAVLHHGLRLLEETPDMPMAVPQILNQPVVPASATLPLASPVKATPPTPNPALIGEPPAPPGTPADDSIGLVPAFDQSDSDPYTLIVVNGPGSTYSGPQAWTEVYSTIQTSEGPYEGWESSSKDIIQNQDGFVPSPPTDNFTDAVREQDLTLTHLSGGTGGQQVTETYSSPAGYPNQAHLAYQVDQYNYTTGQNLGVYTGTITVSGEFTLGYAPAAFPFASTLNFGFSSPGISAGVSGGTLSVTYVNSSGTQHYVDSNFGTAGGSFQFNFSVTGQSSPVSLYYASSNQVFTQGPVGVDQSGGDQFSWGYSAGAVLPS